MATPPTPSPEIVLAVREVHTRLGGAVVQDGVTLEIRRGKIFALAGPIQVLGRDVVGLGDEDALALRRRCGVVFERAALFSSLNVAENVALPLRECARLG